MCLVGTDRTEPFGQHKNQLPGFKVTEPFGHNLNKLSKGRLDARAGKIIRVTAINQWVIAASIFCGAEFFALLRCGDDGRPANLAAMPASPDLNEELPVPGHGFKRPMFVI